MYSYHKDAFRFFRVCARRYGDPFSIKTFASTVVMTSNPEGIEAIFTADPASFDPFEREHLREINGANSIMLLSGMRQKQERKLLARPLAAARMEEHGGAIRELALRRAASYRTGEPFRMLELAERISLEVLLRVLLGVEEPERREIFADALFRLLDSLTPPPFYRKLLPRAGNGETPLARFLKARARLDELIYEQIARQREGDAGQSVAGFLVRARYDDASASAVADGTIRDQMVTLTLAGRETTGTAMAWAFYWLHRNPDVLQRLLTEVDACGPDADPAEIDRLPYLEAVCHETLRLFPTVSDTPRRLRVPFSLLGYELPPGVAVSACISLAHMREDLFPQPWRFRPERFLERTFSPFEFLPFGGGLRRCPGAALALFEMKVVLAALLARYRLRLVRDRPPRLVRRSFIMSPQDGVTMVIEAERRVSSRSLESQKEG
jgi:cytochrome P450